MDGNLHIMFTCHIFTIMYGKKETLLNFKKFYPLHSRLEKRYEDFHLRVQTFNPTVKAYLQCYRLFYELNY